MCGICGAVSCQPGYPLTETQVLAMRDIMEHRGPDDAGHYLADGVALGARRLAILDRSERGHMPMTTPDGRFVIVYNGEVYNYRDLRTRLKARGFVIRSGTDTEVVLNLYADEGPAMLDRLNGMFAVAIWDVRERTLFLARDRLGVKPLYYAQCGQALLFASEEKALFEAGMSVEFDQSVWEELLCFRYVAGERTPYSGVKRLLPGHFMLWRDGEHQVRRWWSLSTACRQASAELPRDCTAWFRATFDSSVDMRRISDVPVGVLLSGGLDSGAVATSLASQAGSGTASFTVRFAEPRYDEGPLAREVADRWGLEYHELFLSPEEVFARISGASRLNDEPLAHGNDIHLHAISELAKSRVTVLLSGEGADELLGGYVRYGPLRSPALLALARPVLPMTTRALGLDGRMAKLARFVALGSIEEIVLYNACDLLPSDLSRLGMKAERRFSYRESVLEDARALYPRDLLRQGMYSDQHTFLCSILDRNDRMTMGASIECRVPFLDTRIVETLAALPTPELVKGRTTKRVLRAALRDRLPASIVNHHKWGFAVPWGNYFRKTPLFRGFLREMPDMAPVCDGPMDRRLLRTAIDRFLAGSSVDEPVIRQLVMIATWYQACVSQSRRAPAARLVAAVT